MAYKLCQWWRFPAVPGGCTGRSADRPGARHALRLAAPPVVPPSLSVCTCEERRARHAERRSNCASVRACLRVCAGACAPVCVVRQRQTEARHIAVGRSDYWPPFDPDREMFDRQFVARVAAGNWHTRLTLGAGGISYASEQGDRRCPPT